MMKVPTWVGAAERNPFAVLQTVAHTHGLHKLGQVRQGLLGRKIDEVLHAHILRGVAFAVKPTMHSKLYTYIITYAIPRTLDMLLGTWVGVLWGT